MTQKNGGEINTIRVIIRQEYPTYITLQNVLDFIKVQEDGSTLNVLETKEFDPKNDSMKLGREYLVEYTAKGACVSDVVYQLDNNPKRGRKDFPAIKGRFITTYVREVKQQTGSGDLFDADH